MIQTVDSEKLANSLDAAWSKLQPTPSEPLRVLIQINTSGEDGKQHKAEVYIESILMIHIFHSMQWRAALRRMRRPHSTNIFALIWSICCLWASWPLVPMASTIAMDPIQTLYLSCRCMGTFARPTICPPMLCRFQWECPTTLTRRYVVWWTGRSACCVYVCCSLTILMIFHSTDRNGQQHSARWHSYFWTSRRQGNRRRREWLEECALSLYSLLFYYVDFWHNLLLLLCPRLTTAHTVASQWRPRRIISSSRIVIGIASIWKSSKFVYVPYIDI